MLVWWGNVLFVHQINTNERKLKWKENKIKKLWFCSLLSTTLNRSHHRRMGAHFHSFTYQTRITNISFHMAGYVCMHIPFIPQIMMPVGESNVFNRDISNPLKTFVCPLWLEKLWSLCTTVIRGICLANVCWFIK